MFGASEAELNFGVPRGSGGWGGHGKSGFEALVSDIWAFPKTRGTLFWGPYNKDPII